MENGRKWAKKRDEEIRATSISGVSARVGVSLCEGVGVSLSEDLITYTDVIGHWT